MYEQGWAAAMVAFLRQLDVLEEALEDDAWEDASKLTPTKVDGELPAELVPTARELVDRIAELERRIIDELDETRSALRDLEARRRAARNYRQSDPIPYPGRLSDD
jgi:hypothetical protein